MAGAERSKARKFERAGITPAGVNIVFRRSVARVAHLWPWPRSYVCLATNACIRFILYRVFNVFFSYQGEAAA